MLHLDAAPGRPPSKNIFSPFCAAIAQNFSNRSVPLTRPLSGFPKTLQPIAVKRHLGLLKKPCDRSHENGHPSVGSECAVHWVLQHIRVYRLKAHGARSLRQPRQNYTYLGSIPHIFTLMRHLIVHFGETCVQKSTANETNPYFR